MNKNLSQSLQNNSHLTQTPISQNIFEKLSKKEIKEFEKLNELFYSSNKHTDINDLAYIISKIETNSYILDMALDKRDDELSFFIKQFNEETIKLIRSLFIIIDGKKLVNEK